MLQWLLLWGVLLTPLYGYITDGRVLLKSRAPQSLAGFWNFSSSVYTGLLRVEKEWRLQNIKGVSAARYELWIAIPPHLRTGDFGLILPPVSAAVKIFFNGHLVIEKGKVSEQSRFPENSSEAFHWYPIKLEFLKPQLEQQLVLEITGFQGGGGIYGNAHIYFGGIEEIRYRYSFLFLVTAFLASAIFMIGVFHLVLVAEHTYRRANLYYVLLSFAMASHVVGMNGLGYYLWDNFLFNAALIHSLVVMLPLAMTGFTRKFFRLQL
ncbi:MAG: hypothetical protein N2Z22_11035, partial [Turneriella sp.]|nr:hypothetical protein [Turneriella sp.]